MKTIAEIRDNRAKLWKAMESFLDTHQTEKGTLSVEDDATYSKMEQELDELTNEVKRMERREAREAELNKPVNEPITARPMKKNDTEDEADKGTAGKAYKTAFWGQIRNKTAIDTPSVKNTLSVGVDTEGGYLVPDEFEKTLVQGLEDENVIRKFAHVITTSSGSHKIPVVATKGSAAWLDESGAFTESDDTFGQTQLDSHKLGTIIKVSQELLTDSAFNVEKYITDEFIRRIGTKEEEAFIIGNGTKKPTGLLSDTDGAEVGVTTASATAITADELIDLFYSLKAPYRRNAVWIFNDTTIKTIRKLKDANGQYLWQPALKDGEYDTILGKRYFTSSFVPEIAAGNKTVIFGDLSYYWIGDRTGITFQRLNERYADYGQVGFLAYKRLDGKLVLPEAIKVLKQKGSSAT